MQCGSYGDDDGGEDKKEENNDEDDNNNSVENIGEYSDGDQGYEGDYIKTSVKTMLMTRVMLKFP